MCYFMPTHTYPLWEPFASVAEWSIASDCKSDGFILRRFKSCPAHEYKNQLNLLVGRFLFVRREKANCFAFVRIWKAERCEPANKRAGWESLGDFRKTLPSILELANKILTRCTESVRFEKNFRRKFIRDQILPCARKLFINILSMFNS